MLEDIKQKFMECGLTSLNGNFEEWIVKASRNGHWTGCSDAVDKKRLFIFKQKDGSLRVFVTERFGGDTQVLEPGTAVNGRITPTATSMPVVQEIHKTIASDVMKMAKIPTLGEIDFRGRIPRKPEGYAPETLTPLNHLPNFTIAQETASLVAIVHGVKQSS